MWSEEEGDDEDSGEYEDDAESEAECEWSEEEDYDEDGGEYEEEPEVGVKWAEEEAGDKELEGEPQVGAEWPAGNSDDQPHYDGYSRDEDAQASEDIDPDFQPGGEEEAGEEDGPHFQIVDDDDQGMPDFNPRQDDGEDAPYQFEGLDEGEGGPDDQAREAGEGDQFDPYKSASEEVLVNYGIETPDEDDIARLLSKLGGGAAEDDERMLPADVEPHLEDDDSGPVLDLPPALDELDGEDILDLPPAMEEDGLDGDILELRRPLEEEGEDIIDLPPAEPGSYAPEEGDDACEDEDIFRRPSKNAKKKLNLGKGIFNLEQRKKNKKPADY